MPVVTCQHCSASITVPSSKIGHYVKCAACQAMTPAGSVPPPAPSLVTLPNPVTATRKTAAQAPQQPPITVQEKMLDKLASIEKMVGLFYRVLVWQIVLAILAVLIFCGGLALRFYNTSLP